MRVSRAGDFCGDEAGKRKGGCAAGCRKRASARLFGRAEEGRAVGVAKVQAECRRGAASFSRRKEPNAADVAKAISENGKRCSVQAERGKRAGARGEWFWYGITSPLMRLQSRKASLIAAFADTCGGAQKGARGSAGALGESRACGLALCGFCGGRGTFHFCGGGAFDFLPPSADGSEGLPRRVRRRWLLAAQRRGWCGALLLLLLLLLLFSPDACGAGLRQCGGGGETGKDCLLFAGQSGVYCKGCVFFIMLPKDYVLIWWITDCKIRK